MGTIATIIKWTFVLPLVILFSVGFVAFISYSRYTGDDLTSEKQLTNIAGIDVKYSISIPTNETAIKFGLTQFNQWLQVAKIANVTEVYNVPKGDWAFPSWNGEALYFVNNGIIYLFQ